MLCDGWAAFPCGDGPSLLRLSHPDGQTECCQLPAVNKECFNERLRMRAIVYQYVILFGCISKEGLLDQGVGALLIPLDMFLWHKVIAVYTPANAA